MERKKPSSRAAAGSSIEVVKAAAWAWYERGSGSDAAKATREHDAMWRHRIGPPRPSRYKLEAARAQSSEPRPRGPREDLNAAANLSLLDEYEIRCISRQLDSLIESSKILYGTKKNAIVSSDDDDDDNDSVTTTSTSTTTSTTRSTTIMRNMKRIVGGFWLRNTAAAVCSGARDGGVVETAVVATRGPYVTHKFR